MLADEPPRSDASSAAASLEVEVVDEDGALPRLAGPWEDLLAATPVWSGFQSCAWVNACRAVGRGEARLFTLCVRDRRETVALFPAELGPAGDLRFVGTGVSNYLGPVYRADRLADVMDALARFLATEPRVALLDLHGVREQSPFLAALRALRIPGWTTARLVPTATCPYVDLSVGWRTVCERHRSQRANLARKWRRLAQLGRLEFAEIVDPEETRALLPALFDLYRERWAGRHESGGFAGHKRAFHGLAAPALAASGLLRLSLLRLDAEPIAFAYGVRSDHATSSYVLAHANALAVHSPGMLLLTRVLEAACARGDREYDLSLGDEEYKFRWATGSRRVFRVLLARARATVRARGAVRRVVGRTWVAARSVAWLRALRREGVVYAVLGRPARPLPDTPGLVAGGGRSWYRSRVPTGQQDGSTTLSGVTYAEMKARLSPRLLAEAVDRNFRGDQLATVRRGAELVGVVWRASEPRRRIVTGGLDPGPADGAVYYHPVAAPGHGVADVVRALRHAAPGPTFLLVTREKQCGAHVVPLGGFAADLRFVLTSRSRTRKETPPTGARGVASPGSAGAKSPRAPRHPPAAPH